MNIPRTTEGFKLVGSPISQARDLDQNLVPVGNIGLLTSFLTTKLQKLKHTISHICRIKHTQSAFQLLLLSANSRISYLLRSLSAADPLSPFHAFIRNFDEAIMNAFQDIMSCPQINAQQNTQIRLPETLSGIGLLSATHVAPSAFIGSARQALHELTIRNITPTIFHNLYDCNELNQTLAWFNDLRSNWESYNAPLLRNNHPSALSNFTNEAFLNLNPHHLQHELFQRISKSTFQKLFEEASISDRIRLQSCKGTGAAAFLRAPASFPGFFFRNDEFKMAIKIRIRAPLGLPCPSQCVCGTHIDPYGDHLFKCKIGGEWQHRHSSMIHIIADIARSTNLIVQHEVPLSSLGPLRNLDRSGDGRMDMIITSGDFTPTMADVTITHPSLSQSMSPGDHLCAPLHYAQTAERKKMAKYGSSAREMHHRFIPIAIESYGSVGSSFASFLKEMATRYLQQNDADRNTEFSARAVLIRFWRVKISVCLQKANARLLQSKISRLNRRMRHGSNPCPPEVHLQENWTIE